MEAGVLLVAVLTTFQRTPLDAVLARLDAYLAAYEPGLSELVADEVMQQEVRVTEPLQPADLVRGRRETRLRRRLDAEVAFIALPDAAGWLGFRHVTAVNTKPVALSDSPLIDLLRLPGLTAAKTLLDESATHNLGLPRTTNLPNLPLEFLHARNRKRWLIRADGNQAIRGIRTMRIVLLERVTPTLIRNPDTGADMPSVARAWIDPENGRLLRAEVSTFAQAGARIPQNTVTVEFAEDRTLGLFVPVEMRETFPAERGAAGTSVARYSNFRRFQTSARIVPQ
ncbi:MAG TPA: hypothetical protein VEA16_09625 [Vicinamibacterales bacterium]|nr:hypothetical protein [Vicinamibacterales bacterium]